MKKIAVIGSSTFPLSTPIGAQVVEVLREYGSDTLILTRNAETGFDHFVAAVAIALGQRCMSFKGAGRSDNFVRDAELVEACDEMVAFIDPAALDAPHRGTAMVIERALTAGKKVRAATPVEGNLVWADS